MDLANNVRIESYSEKYLSRRLCGDGADRRVRTHAWAYQQLGMTWLCRSDHKKSGENEGASHHSPRTNANARGSLGAMSALHT